MSDALYVIMHWLHISSVAALVGGLLYARLAMSPASGTFAPEAREALSERAAAAFRPVVIAAIAGLIVSGMYNILSSPGHSVRYHIALGIKVLLAVHVFAVSLLMVQPNHPRRARLMTGALLSGFTIILISVYLRRIF
jgi:putative copper export protein